MIYKEFEIKLFRTRRSLGLYRYCNICYAGKVLKSTGRLATRARAIDEAKNIINTGQVKVP